MTELATDNSQYLLTNTDTTDVSSQSDEDNDQTQLTENNQVKTIYSEDDYVLSRSYIWDAKKDLLNSYIKDKLLPNTLKMTDDEFEANERFMALELNEAVQAESDEMLAKIQLEENKDINKIKKRMRSSGSLNIKRYSKQLRIIESIHKRYRDIYYILEDNVSESILFDIQTHQLLDEDNNVMDGGDDDNDSVLEVNPEDIHMVFAINKWLIPLYKELNTLKTSQDERTEEFYDIKKTKIQEAVELITQHLKEEEKDLEDHIDALKFDR